MSASIVMHKGGQQINENVIRMLPVPPSTDSFQPISHALLLDLVRDEVVGRDMVIADEKFFINRNGNHFFGVLDLEGPYDDYCSTIALRNSHLKDFRASVALGSRVFICDNLAMSGDVQVGRKHTVNIERDLPRLVADGIGKLTVVAKDQEKRIGHYKATELDRPAAEHALVRSIELGVIPVTHIKKVWTSWKTDERWGDDFTAWRMMNAITANWVQSTPQLIAELMPRSRRLYTVLDDVAGFLPNDEVIEGQFELLEAA